MAVRRSKFWKNCVMKMSMETIPRESISSTSRRMSISHSKWRWLPVIQMKYSCNVTQVKGLTARVVERVNGESDKKG